LYKILTLTLNCSFTTQCCGVHLSVHPSVASQSSIKTAKCNQANNITRQSTKCTRGTKNLQLPTSNSLYLKNGTQQMHSFYERQIGSRIHCIEWWHCWWPQV